MRRASALIILFLASVATGPVAFAGGGGCGMEYSAASGTHVDWKQYCATPSVLHAKVGDQITFTNADETVHTLTSGAGNWSSTELRPGQTVAHLFETAGLYPYYCMLHPGMAGVIDIASPDTALVGAGTQPAKNSGAPLAATIIGLGAALFGFAVGRRRAIGR